MAAHLAVPFLSSPYLGTTSSTFFRQKINVAEKAASLALASADSPGSRSPAKAKRAAATSTTKSSHGSGFKKPLDISPALQQFLGTVQASRADTIKLVWEYIKNHDLQSDSDRRMIVCDEKLKELLGKDQCNFLELAKLLSPHFVKSA